jgi:hypothetical protein
MSALLESAIAYAEAGFRVHPCRPNQKEPILDGWQKLATRDPGTIASWWGRRPNANVAIACGGPARLLVVPEAARTEGTGINASTDSVSLFKTVPAHSCTACGPSHLKALVLGCYGLAEKGLGAPNRNRSPRAGLGFGVIHKSERSPPMSLPGLAFAHRRSSAGRARQRAYSNCCSNQIAIARELRVGVGTVSRPQPERPIGNRRRSPSTRR